MKVLQICSKPPVPEVDGGCKAMNSITEGLFNNNVTVKVLTISTLKHPFLRTELKEDYLSKTQIESSAIDTRVKSKAAFLNLFSKTSYNIDRFYDKPFSDLVVATLKAQTFDIILLESLYVTPYIAEIIAVSDAKIVYRAHNIEHQIWERNANYEKNILKKQYFKFLANRLKQYEVSLLNKVDAIVSISKKDREGLMSLGCIKPIHVTPFGFNLDDALPFKKLQSVTNFFHIGSMDWEPNQEGMKWFFEHVWGKLITDNNTLQFNLAGKRMPDWLVNWKQKKVNIIGEVDDALAFIQHNDVMIVPLFVGSGMRIKIIEGMAMGKLVIATTIAAEGIEYTNGENILIANTPQEFITAIIKVTKDVVYANKIGGNAKKMIESNYDNSIIAINLVQFFKRLL